MDKYEDSSGYGDLDNREDPGEDEELEATGGEAVLVKQALLRQTVKKMSLLASHGSGRSSNSGKKLNPENLILILFYPMEIVVCCRLLL